jgi:hypothetical protein
VTGLTKHPFTGDWFQEIPGDATVTRPILDKTAFDKDFAKIPLGTFAVPMTDGYGRVVWDNPNLKAYDPSFYDNWLLGVQTKQKMGSTSGFQRWDGPTVVREDLAPYAGQPVNSYFPSLMEHEVQHKMGMNQGFSAGAGDDFASRANTMANRDDLRTTKADLELALHGARAGTVKGLVGDPASWASHMLLDPSAIPVYEDRWSRVADRLDEARRRPNSTSWQIYATNYGEVMARTAQKRLGYSPMQRAAEPFHVTTEKMLKDEGLDHLPIWDWTGSKRDQFPEHIGFPHDYIWEPWNGEVGLPKSPPLKNP